MGCDRFEFKQFGINHRYSSMKVGIDSILLGSWTRQEGVNKILDVGTGCGILALMCAQRNSDALIEAIEIDYASVKEAEENFITSPWRERISISQTDFMDFKGKNYDLIISNPPFFNSGINKIVNSRERARHQDTLSPKILIEKGSPLLSSSGKISMIVPSQQTDDLIHFAMSHGMSRKRLAVIKGRKELCSKRTMIEFVNSDNSIELEEAEETEIILEESPGHPTEQFKMLCKDFYLHF